MRCSLHFVFMGPQSLQIKLNTRSFKNVGVTPSAVPGTHLPSSGNTWLVPKREGRGAVGAGGPAPAPSQARRLGRLGRRRDRASYLGQHMHCHLCISRKGCVCVALGFREVTFAPLQVTSLACCCRGRRLRELHLALPWLSTGYSFPQLPRLAAAALPLTFAEDWVSACGNRPRHLGKGC